MFTLFKKFKNLFENQIDFLLNSFSNFIKKKKKLFKIFYFYFDWSTWFIGVMTRDFRIFIPFCLCLILMPTYYHRELLSYYEFLYQNDWSFSNIVLAICKFFPFPFLIVILLFLFLLFFSITVTPLLFLKCLSDELKSNYGSNILKERQCNSKAKAATSGFKLAFCLICGQDIAGRVIAHGREVDAQREVALRQGTPMPRVPYNGPFDAMSVKIGVTLDGVREFFTSKK